MIRLQVLRAAQVHDHIGRRARRRPSESAGSPEMGRRRLIVAQRGSECGRLACMRRVQDD